MDNPHVVEKLRMTAENDPTLTEYASGDLIL
jgi:hypothetical protein